LSVTCTMKPRACGNCETSTNGDAIHNIDQRVEKGGK
jgi:hypothetical protein